MAMTRRQWLASAAATGLCAAVFPAAASPPPIKLSVAAYSYRKHLPEGLKRGTMTLFDLFDMAAEWGLPAVEPTSYYFTSSNKHYFHQLKAKAFRLGLDISGTAIRNNFCHPDERRRVRDIAHVKRWVDNAIELGAPCIRIFGGNKHPSVLDEQAYLWILDSLREVCDYAGDRGIYLAIENHGYLTESAAEVLRIVGGVDHDWLGVNLDSGNFTSRPYENFAELAPYAVNVQLKVDVVNDDGNGRRPGDYGRLLQILRDANYRGYVALEYEGEEDPLTGFPKFLDQVRAAAKAMDANA